MKIIVGGAGSVGRSIIDYLSRGSNEVIVVDVDQDRLGEISREFDVQPVLGSISHPEVQEKIGAEKADMIIAATDNDEVNMVACQVAYSLFKIPRKIARIDSEFFLSPLWNTLFNEKNLPIDLVISPDTEIAEAILRIVDFPGVQEVLPLVDDKLRVIGFKCKENCQLYNFNIAEIYENFKHINFTILQIGRGGKNFFPKADENIECGDDIYLLSARENLAELLHAFGINQKVAENIVIFGGNAISYEIARSLEENDNVLNCKIVTNNALAAQKLADVLDKTAVIQGEMMSDVILRDAGLDLADMSIAVTLQDKDNLLASLLAKNSHICSTISLVNSRAYDNLIDNIGDNIIIDRTTVTISKILQDLRRVSLRNAFALGRGFAEMWELKINETSLLAGRRISELNLPEKCRVAAIVQDEKIILMPQSERIHENDTLIIFVSPSGIKRTEQIFGY